MPLANVKNLDNDDLLSSDTNCIILSNVNAADRVLVNTAEVTELVDSRKLNVEVLENVFKQFTAKLGPFNYETTQHQYAVLGMNGKKKQPVYFEYDTYTWRGTVSYHKWTEPRCDEVWTTTALKLPNDGYIYNLAFERRTKRNYTELVEEQAVKLVNILEFTRAFFGDSRVTFKFLYRAREGRCEFKVRCMEKKAWMYITFEYGTPEGVYDEGYDMDVMDRLLTTARARQTNQ